MATHPWDAVASCLAWPGWDGEGPSVPAQLLGAPPLSFLARAAVPSWVWTLISFMQAQPYRVLPPTHAMCLWPPAPGTQYPEPTHMPPRSVERSHGGRHPVDVRFPSLPRMTGHFVRPKQPVADSRGQIVSVLLPFLLQSPRPLLLLRGTTCLSPHTWAFVIAADTMRYFVFFLERKMTLSLMV